MQAVAADIGYGQVKWVAGSRRGRFEAAWAPHTLGAESWGLGNQPDGLHIGDRTVIAGDRAASLPGAHRPFGAGRLADPEALPLLAQALWESRAEGEVVLGSGTPLGAFAQERAAARAVLEGRMLRLSDGGRERTVRIARVVLRPQGVGAALFLAAQGRIPPGPGFGLVVDVGSRTTDVLCLELRDLTPVAALSFSLESGVSTVAGALAASIQRATGHLPPPDLAQAALSGPVTWHGQICGGPAEAGPHLDALAEIVAAELRRRLGGDLGRVGATALVGGGALLLGDRLTALSPGRPIPLWPEEAVFANALGYMWAAERALRAVG